MTTKKWYAIANAVVIFGIILSGFTRNQGDRISNVGINYPNLFSPAGYAFSIWFLIYVCLGIFAIHQIRVAWGKVKNEETLLKIGPFLLLALLSNEAWSYVWFKEMISLSPLFLGLSFVFLFTAVMRLKMQVTSASENIRKYTWFTLSIFSGWMMAAFTVGLSTYLAYLGLGQSSMEAQINWAIVILVVVSVLYYTVFRLRKMFAFAMVGVWTLMAISVEHWGKIPMLQFTALILALILLLVCVSQWEETKKWMKK